jgi:ankyrin repeat protein
VRPAYFALIELKFVIPMTDSKSIHIPRFPQYAYALAIFGGGIGYVLPQAGVSISTWQSYFLLALLFGSIWPTKALHWAAWICLPIGMLVFVEYFASWNLGVILSNVFVIIKALASASLGAYIGTKLSIRKLAGRVANRKVERCADAQAYSLPLVSFAPPIRAPLALTSGNGSHELVRAGEQSLGQNFNDALMNAVQENDIDALERAIQAGADINAATCDHLTLFHAPAPHTDANTINALFGREATPDQSPARQWTALMIATIEGHVQVVRQLIAKGADLDVENDEGWTAARFAVSMDEAEILRMLLEAGANPDTRDHQHKTALMQASAENIQASLKVLLDAGADMGMKDRSGQTALTIAQNYGHAEIVRLIKQANSLCASNKESRIQGDVPPVSIENAYRVITIPRNPYVGLVDRYDVIPANVPLPEGWVETGWAGPEEECREYASKSNITKPSELGWWLVFSS